MTITVGLDVGGAHLKVARFENDALVDVRQFACPLWKGLENLGLALNGAVPLLAGAEQVAITMTGELSDLFDSRKEGVEVLADSLTAGFGPKARFFLGRRGFCDAETAKAHPDDTGSMNFLATAEAVGRLRETALLIDFGSTTVDIIAVRRGIPETLGLSDAERQTTGELVYTGLTRTAVMGVVRSVPFQGRWVGLAREYLATMADVRRVLGDDLDGIDVHATADGRGKSVEESLVRLARLFGRESMSGTPAAWRVCASYIREAQLRSIVDGAYLVLSARPLPDGAPVVSAGIGEREVAEVSGRLGRDCESFGQIIGLDGALMTAATHHAPAVAVGLLLQEADKTPMRAEL
jgi:(4-(4-[2-(gamma-L-glutamylamino)ethyl]phenoxymethyl)furan-2-yl)methanamine synthase